ncbi:CDP-diacylglycerol--serine O-phosphatidyltransferase [Dipodascopsis uninucleata]
MTDHLLQIGTPLLLNQKLIDPVFRTLHMADFITLLNGLCGVMSIQCSLRYCLGDPSNYYYLWWAIILTPFGLFFDFMDGKVARLRKKSSAMGQELDSLADLISFGVAPSCCAFCVGFRSVIDTAVLVYFVLCGLSRLARFNVTVAYLPKDKSGKSKYFEGTPIPTTLSLVFMIAYWVRQGWVLDDIPYGVVGKGEWYEFHPSIFLFFLSGCAMISKSLHIPKI